MANTTVEKAHQAMTPATQEAANIANEAANETFQQMIKFKREGEVSGYWSDGQEIQLGTQMIAHALAWTKCWIKFRDKQVVERKIYRIAKGDRAPERDQLDEQDESKWPIGLNNKPADPWTLQYLVPLESMDGEVRIFVASSFGGRRAVSELCSAYGRRRVKDPNGGQPIIRLQKALMPTRNFGDVPRPLFEIVGWDDGQVRTEQEVDIDKMKKQEFDDEIPF